MHQFAFQNSESTLFPQISSAYAFAGFPYDNLCQADNPEFGAAGRYTVFLGSDPSPREIDVTRDEKFVYCRQDWKGFKGLPFPPTANSQPSGARWMGNSQETLANVYGWTAVAFFVGYVALFFGGAILNYLRSWWRGVYTSSGTT